MHFIWSPIKFMWSWFIQPETHKYYWLSVRYTALHNYISGRFSHLMTIFTVMNTQITFLKSPYNVVSTFIYFFYWYLIKLSNNVLWGNLELYFWREKDRSRLLSRIYNLRSHKISNAIPNRYFCYMFFYTLVIKHVKNMPLSI